MGLAPAGSPTGVGGGSGRGMGIGGGGSVIGGRRDGSDGGTGGVPGGGRVVGPCAFMPMKLRLTSRTGFLPELLYRCVENLQRHRPLVQEGSRQCAQPWA